MDSLKSKLCGCLNKKRCFSLLFGQETWIGSGKSQLKASSWKNCSLAAKLLDVVEWAGFTATIQHWFHYEIMIEFVNDLNIFFFKTIVTFYQEKWHYSHKLHNYNVNSVSWTQVCRLWSMYCGKLCYCEWTLVRQKPLWATLKTTRVNAKPTHASKPASRWEGGRCGSSASDKVPFTSGGPGLCFSCDDGWCKQALLRWKNKGGKDDI